LEEQDKKAGKPDPTKHDHEAEQARSHNERAKKLFEAGQYAEAEAEVREAIRIAPNWAALHDNLGTICSEQNKFQEALIHYVDALRLDPESPTVRYNLGYFLLQSGLDVAQHLLEKTLEREPLYPDARRALGDLFLERNETSRAIAAFARAIEQNPKDSRARFRLADIFWEQGDYHESAQQLQAIINYQAEDSVAWHNLGLAAIMLQDYSRAEECLLKAIKLDAEYLLAHYHLACYYAESYRIDDAFYYLSNALALDYYQVQEWAQNDEKLDHLRSHPRFKQIIMESQE
jgi:Flp pilus assembly protein TadD